METIWKIKHSTAYFLKRKKTHLFMERFFLFLKISFFIIMICSLIISFWTGNIFSFLEVIWLMIGFTLRHDNINILNDVLINWAIYILIGLSVVVAFRAGLFNIGVSGQMLLSGLYVICFNVFADDEKNFLHGFKTNLPFLWFFFTLFSAIMASMLIGLVVAFLRNKYRISEVVTTIFFNWILWYFVKWFFEKNDYADNGRSKDFNADFLKVNIFGRELTYLYFLLLAVFFFYVVYVVINKTTFGYYFKVISKDNDVSHFAGINKNFYSTLSILFSTMLAGVAGFIYYQKNNINFVHDTVPLIGFEGLTVALVAQSNVVAVLFTALLIGSLRYSLQIVQLFGGGKGENYTQVPEAFSEIVLGIIILFTVLVPFFKSFSFRKKLVSFFFFFFALTKKTFFRSLKEIISLSFKNYVLRVRFLFSKRKKEFIKGKIKVFSAKKNQFESTVQSYFWTKTRIGKFLNFRKEVCFIYASYWKVFQRTPNLIKKDYFKWQAEKTKILAKEREELLGVRNKYYPELSEDDRKI